MSTMALEQSPRRRKAFGMLVGSEIKLTCRYPVVLIVGVGVPLVLVVIFGSIPATTRPENVLGGVSFFNQYVPTLLVFVLMAVGLRRFLPTAGHLPPPGRAAEDVDHPGAAVLAAGRPDDRQPDRGSHRDRDHHRHRSRRLWPEPPAHGRRLPRVARDARPHRRSDPRARAVRGRLWPAPHKSPRPSPQDDVLPAGVLLRAPYFPIAYIHSAVITQISKVLPTGAGFNALHAAFTGHSPGAEPLIVLAAWAVLTGLAARSPVPLGVGPLGSSRSRERRPRSVIVVSAAGLAGG